MLIRCPQCGFDREIDPSQIPANAVMATCPRCEARFRFRNADGSPFAGDASNSMPLPPRAVIVPNPSARLDRSEELPSPEGRPSEAKAPGKEGSQPGLFGNLAEALRRLFYGSQPANPDKPESEAESSFPESEAASKERAAARENAASELPWENPERYGQIGGFYLTILRVMFGASAFFRAVGKAEGPLSRPAIFYLLMGVFQILVERMQRLWLVDQLEGHLPSLADPQLQEVFNAVAQGSSLPLTLLFSPLWLGMQLLFYSGVFFLMLRLVQPEGTRFATVFRVVSYSAAPTVLCLVPLLGPLLAAFWFALACLVGCRYALDLSWPGVLLALGPLYAVGLAVAVQVARTLGAA